MPFCRVGVAAALAALRLAPFLAKPLYQERNVRSDWPVERETRLSLSAR